jgi:hypothetical protein
MGRWVWEQAPATGGGERRRRERRGQHRERLGQRLGERREIGEKKEKERGDERGVLTCEPHCHLASTLAKPATKTI